MAEAEPEATSVAEVKAALAKAVKAEDYAKAAEVKAALAKAVKAEDYAKAAALQQQLKEVEAQSAARDAKAPNMAAVGKSEPSAGPDPAAVDVTVGRPVWRLDELPEGVALKKKDEKAGWMCSGRPGASCGFINFPHRTSCKECGAVRLGTAEGKKKAKESKKPAVRGPIGKGKGEGKGGKGEGRSPRAPTAEDGGASTAWAGTNLAGAAEANAALRAQFRANPSSLSEEDQERARQLVARDERKHQTKSARKAALSHAEGQGGGSGKGKGEGKGGKGGKGEGKGKGKGKGGGSGGKGGGRGAAGPGIASTTRGPAPGERRDPSLA